MKVESMMTMEQVATEAGLKLGYLRVLAWR